MTLTELMRENELWQSNEMFIGTSTCIATLGCCEVVESDGSLTSFAGHGQTITEAVADMLTKIRGKRLVCKKVIHPPYEFDVPEDLTND